MELTDKQDEKLTEAIGLVTIDKLENLEHGEEVALNDTFTLYKYTEEDIVVINLTETWDELLQVLWSKEQDDIVMEQLY